MLSRALSMFGIAAKPKVMAPEAFRARIKAALLAVEPAAVIAETGPLTLMVDPDHEQPYPIDLTKVYSVYQMAPERLETLVTLFSGATLQVLQAGSPPLSLDMLVPLLRTVEDAASLPPCVQEPINDHMVAVYALDLPHDIALVEERHLLLLGIEVEDIAVHAAATMDSLVEAARIDVEDGVIAITAEGGNASSFAFSVALWEQPGFAEMPAIAVIAPERDLLLAYDPADEVAAENAMGIAAEVLAQSEAPLSLAPMYVKGGPPVAAPAPAPAPVPLPPVQDTAPAPVMPTRGAPVSSAPSGPPAATAALAPALAPPAARPPVAADHRQPTNPSAIRQLAAGMRRAT